MINRGIHVEGHSVKACYRLVSFNEKSAILYNQATKQTIENMPLDRLRYSRKNEPK
jgi:hypothetical protein